jgi:hypothetical protein
MKVIREVVARTFLPRKSTKETQKKRLKEQGKGSGRLGEGKDSGVVCFGLTMDSTDRKG